MYDVIVIGMGPAGMSAGVYAKRHGLDVLVIGEIKGGQITMAHKICNYFGFDNISGLELADRGYKQVTELGVKTILNAVKDVKKTKNGFMVETGTKSYEGKRLIIATGAQRKRLGVPGEGKFLGKGVSYCATCDAPLFKGRVVAVVGGGNTALTAALLLAEYAKEVKLIHRRQEFRGEKAWVDEINRAKNITKVLGEEVKEIRGDTCVKSVALKSGKELKVDGVFIEVGAEPKVELAKELGVKLKNGYISVDDEQRTSVDGIYAAGDVTGGLKQIINAAAQGAKASVNIFEELKKEK